MQKKQKKDKNAKPKDKFFKKIEDLGEALTFDDVRLKSGYSEIMLTMLIWNQNFLETSGLKFQL